MREYIESAASGVPKNNDKKVNSHIIPPVFCVGVLRPALSGRMAAPGVCRLRDNHASDVHRYLGIYARSGRRFICRWQVDSASYEEVEGIGNIVLCGRRNTHRRGGVYGSCIICPRHAASFQY